MSFGNIIGQLLQQGMAANSRERLDHALGAQGLGGMDGLGELLGSLAGGQGGRQSAARGNTGGLGDLLDLATGALGGGRGGSASSGGGLGDLASVLLGGANGRGAQSGGLGGLGDLAGVLLGGGSSRSRTGDGAGNGGMAILGTLAVAAFKYWQQSQVAGAGSPMPAVAPQQFAELTSARSEALVLRAMISAAKADGEVDDEEISRIVDKIDDDGVSEDEKRFIADALRAPVDLPALAADVPDTLVGAQVYAASLLAINLDTDAERAYLRRLAQLLQLDAGVVERLHTLTGAPRT